MKATLEPNRHEINGGEHHQVEFTIDSDGYLKLEVDCGCYGTYSTSFDILLPSIGPDELERFASSLHVLVHEMRKNDAAQT
jgi:hypothetical protein